jgi:dTMP kinase
MSNRGKYIVIEGPEGVGKTTQLNELARRLQAAGFPVRTLREPDSQSDLTARAIRHLTQDPRYPMNTRTEVLLYNAARSQSLEVIHDSVEQGIICLVDRNYLTTLAIQYYGRGDVPDYQTISSIIKFAVGDNEPDLCIVMDAPAPVLKSRVKDRYNGERFDNLDEAFLERVRAGYLWEAKQRNFPVVFATNSTDKVADQIWELVSKELSVRSNKTPAEPTPIKQIIAQKQAAPHEPPIENTKQVALQTAPDPVITEDAPLVEKTQYGMKATEAGKAWLKERVTNVEGNVYATTKNIDAMTVAAAMARLSRRGDDMRITMLDEFAGNMDKDQKLIQRVITAYGDDSVQQLVGQYIIVEGATKLLTNVLEWGRLAAYLEQSTRYIYFDTKDENGKYRYYIPTTLKPAVKKQYVDAMDTIFDLYSSMVHNLTSYIENKSDTPQAERDGAWRSAIRAQACDAVRVVLPTSVTTTVGIFASGQALESLIMHLLSNEFPEARDVGQQILTEARKVLPTFLERADKPDRGGAIIAYRAQTSASVKEIAEKDLPAGYASATDPVTLVDYWPRNELSLVADMLYEHSDLSLEDIQKETETWSYDKKSQVLNAYVGERLNRRHRPGRAIEKAHYNWDLVCDFGIFCDLMRHRMVDDLEWQALTPRYGYETPQLIEDAGLTEQFEACFEISLKLYSLLQKSGYALEAQYATLLGHKMRWKITYNAREAFHLHELRTSPQGHPGYRKLVMQMHEKLTEVHPQLGAAMRFVNTDEDPALTRLAAERYTQYKLSKLSE